MSDERTEPVDFEGGVFGWASRYLRDDEIGPQVFHAGDDAGIVDNYQRKFPLKNASIGNGHFYSSTPHGDAELGLWADGRIRLPFKFYNSRKHNGSRLYLQVWWRWQDSGHRVKELPVISIERDLRIKSGTDGIHRPHDKKLKTGFHMLGYTGIEFVGHIQIYNPNHFPLEVHSFPTVDTGL